MCICYLQLTQKQLQISYTIQVIIILSMIVPSVYCDSMSTIRLFISCAMSPTLWRTFWNSWKAVIYSGHERRAWLSQRTKQSGDFGYYGPVLLIGRTAGLWCSFITVRPGEMVRSKTTNQTNQPVHGLHCIFITTGDPRANQRYGWLVRSGLTEIRNRPI